MTGILANILLGNKNQNNPTPNVKSDGSINTKSVPAPVIVSANAHLKSIKVAKANRDIDQNLEINEKLFNNKNPIVKNPVVTTNLIRLVINNCATKNFLNIVMFTKTINKLSQFIN